MRTKFIESYVLTTGAYALDNPIRRFDQIFEEFFRSYEIIPIERLSKKFVRNITKNNN